MRFHSADIYERCNAFYVRYYTTENGRGVQRSEFLCEKDAKHRHPEAATVQALREEFMQQRRETQPPDEISKERTRWAIRESGPGSAFGWEKERLRITVIRSGLR